MRYHYQVPEEWDVTAARRYELVGHPICYACSLYLQKGKGIGLIQQYSNANKTTYWAEIYPFLIDDIFSQQGFETFFNKYAALPDDNGWYPLIPVRKAMWALRMHPLPKERWETTFDHIPV